MKIFKHKSELQNYLKHKKTKKGLVGFVPTMGALHEGHMALIQASREENELTVCSIFVNPTQFNDAVDFEKYPRTIGADLILLERNHCDVVFIPDVDEMYQNHQSIHPDLDGLDTKLEGVFRPGHFDGVVQIVYLLLKAIQPDRLYMGLKDFQQQAIIRRMIKVLDMPVVLRSVETLREANGLAMSSRNQRLTADQRKAAGVIYKTLEKAGQNLLKGYAVQSVIDEAIADLQIPNTKLEYFKVCDPDTLDEIKSFNDRTTAVILVTIWWGDVRLIDNLLVKRN